MSGAFGLIDDPGNPYHVPPEQFVEAHPCVDVFALYREGLLVPGASATLQTDHGGSQLASHEVGISIGDQSIAVRSHTALPLPVFVCPGCNRDCYRLYDVGGTWACRKCHRLDYASRHRHRSIPGYNRILYLRRRIGADLRPFSEIPQRPKSQIRYHRVVAEIRALEARLVGHLRTDVNDALERRIKLRGMLPK